MFHKNSALLIVDVQNDFCTGNLSVPNALDIVPAIQTFMGNFSTVALTQDWHPPEHISFASTHQKQPLQSIKTPYGTQTLWPDHCIQNTWGAAIIPQLDCHQTAQRPIILKKGMRATVDSYSAFIESDGQLTALHALLEAQNIQSVYVVGLALEVCVAWTALDARRLGYKVCVPTQACRGLSPKGVASACQKMTQAGINLII